MDTSAFVHPSLQICTSCTMSMESTTLFTPVVHLELCNFVHLLNITPNFVEDVTDSLCLCTMCGMLDSIDTYLHCICIMCCSFFAVNVNYGDISCVKIVRVYVE